MVIPVKSTEAVFGQGAAHFDQRLYITRISGDIKELSINEIEERAKADTSFNISLHDIKKYPATNILYYTEPRVKFTTLTMK